MAGLLSKIDEEMPSTQSEADKGGAGRAYNEY